MAASPLRPPSPRFCAADAGADWWSYLDEHTGYDIVQTAANNGHFDVVLRLVEAGAPWRLARGQQRVRDGSVYYVPEMLNINVPSLKVGEDRGACE